MELVFMKKMIVLLVACSAFWVACQAKTEDKGSVEERLTSLENELTQVKKALKYKGLDIQQVIAEMKSIDKTHDIPVDDSPVSGPENAPISIVEFSDFQCPYCYQRSQLVKNIQEKYPNKVKVMFKHFPLSFHKKAPKAHAASMAAQKQGKFWEYRYGLAPFYKELTDAKMLEIAKNVGLNIEQFNADRVLAGNNQKRIDSEMKLGMKIGVKGTPTFFVNGKYTRGFSPQLIDEMVAKLK